MTYWKGQLYVSGTFTSAGGIRYTSNLARWDGSKWSNVVGNCYDNCARVTNNYPFSSTDFSVDPGVRLPPTCNGIRTLNNRVYCVDGSKNALHYWDGSLWRQTGVNPVSTGAFQNSLVMLNGTNTDFILLTSNAIVDGDSNSLASWNRFHENYEPSFSGFSVSINAMAPASTVVLSQLILFIIALFFSLSLFF